MEFTMKFTKLKALQRPGLEESRPFCFPGSLICLDPWYMIARLRQKISGGLPYAENNIPVAGEGVRIPFLGGKGK